MPSGAIWGSGGISVTRIIATCSRNFAPVFQQPLSGPDVSSELGYCTFQPGAAPPSIIRLGGAVCILMGLFRPLVERIRAPRVIHQLPVFWPPSSRE